MEVLREKGCPAPAKIAAAAMDEGRTIFTANAKAPGAATLPFGLRYKVVESSPPDGAKLRRGDDVDIRTADRATARNPWPIIVPYHRVLCAWRDRHQTQTFSN